MESIDYAVKYVIDTLPKYEKPPELLIGRVIWRLQTYEWRKEWIIEFFPKLEKALKNFDFVNNVQWQRRQILVATR